MLGHHVLYKIILLTRQFLWWKYTKEFFLCISINKEIRWSKADLRIPLMINGKSMPGQKHLEYIILYTQIITAYLIGCVLVLFLAMSLKSLKVLKEKDGD